VTKVLKVKIPMKEDQKVSKVKSRLLKAKKVLKVPKVTKVLKVKIALKKDHKVE